MSWEFNAEDIVESAGKIRLGDRRGEEHQMLGGKGEFEPFENISVNTARIRPLLGESENILFGFRISPANFITI